MPTSVINPTDRHVGSRVRMRRLMLVHRFDEIDHMGWDSFLLRRLVA